MKTKSFLPIMSVTILVFALLVSPPVSAGTGTVSAGSPAKINLSVYFDYDESDPDSWKTVFESASSLLYDGTERQIQLGKIKVFNRCPAKKDEADVLISDGTEGAKAHVKGLGRIGRHLYISQTHKSTSGSALGQFGIVHELGHYAFGVYDEYRGTKTFTILPPGFPIATPSEDFFCTGAGGSGIASIMDGGTTVSPANSRTEFCTITSDGFPTSHESGYARSQIDILGVPFATLIRNDQQIKNGESAWETIVRVMKDKYGITIVAPLTEPTSDTTGHQAIDWMVEDCTPTVVFVLDRSGSMRGSPISLAKTGASLAVNLLKPGSRLGVASFSSTARTDFVLQEVVGEATKDSAKAIIDGLVATGLTNIGGGLRTALNMITGLPDRSGNEIIVLLTDGQHNRGENPSSVLPDIVAAGIKINGIGLGSSLSVALLQALASETNGEAIFVREAIELPAALVRQSADSEGNNTISLVSGDLDASEQESVAVFVDGFTDEVIFSSSWDVGQIGVTVSDPSGAVIQPTDPAVEFIDTGTSTFLRISNPQSGTWTVSLTADAANQQPSRYSVQTLDRSLNVEFSASADTDQITFPESTKVEALITLDGFLVGDASVQGTVTRPDGSNETFTLFDDGANGHGDETANDGIYSGVFARYSGSGNYTFEVSIDTEDGNTLHPNEEDPSFVSKPVGRAVRLDTFNVDVQGVPATIPPGSLSLAPAFEALPEFEVMQDIPDQRMLAFALTASFEESVSVTQLRVNGSGTGDETRVGQVKLYRDTDGDNAIDLVGAFALPLATATFDQDDGFAEFDSPLIVPAGETVNLLVTYDLEVSTLTAETTTVALLKVSLPLVAVFGFIGVFGGPQTGRRSRLILALISVMLLAGLATSCGGGSGGGTPPVTPDPPVPPPPPVEVTFSAGIAVGDIIAEGATSGAPLVTFGTAQVDGPTITISN